MVAWRHAGNGIFGASILPGVRRLSRVLAAASCLSSFGCAGMKEPAREIPAVPVAERAAPAPSAPAAASSSPPEQEPEAPPAAQPYEVDYGPKLDCAKFPKGNPPDLHWLCEVAMGERPVASILDARGFAAVGYYERPGEGDEAGLARFKERLCGRKAEERLDGITRTLRYKLWSSLIDQEQVVCKGLSCTLSGQGEYATWDTLGFRRKGNELVLESWSSVETTLIPEAEVGARLAWVGKALYEVKHKPCR